MLIFSWFQSSIVYLKSTASIERLMMNVLSERKFLLPVNKEGEIDFAFMSSFMQEVEADILKTTLKVFKDRLNANENKIGGGKMESIYPF